MKLLNLTIITLIMTLFSGVQLEAQKDSKWSELDKSPFDMAYYPAKAAWRNYLRGDDRELSPRMRITYSRPGVNGRTVFGDLVPYGKEWRLGANESTQLTVYNAVEINGQTLNRGNYSLSATPQADKWTIHISSQVNTWGSANRDPEKTVTSIEVPTEKLDATVENLAMAFQRVDDESAHLVMDWENTRVRLPIGMNPVQFEELDVSPMDQVHYPSNSAFQNYLKEDELATADPMVKVIYGRPQKKGRKVFGEMLEYGKVWRVGANESTEVNFFQDVTINGERLRRGTYNLYAVVNEGSWDFIFNTDRPAWGPPNRDESKDVMTYTATVSMDTEDLEVLNIIFEDKGENAVDMVIAWEKHRASIPIMFK